MSEVITIVEPKVEVIVEAGARGLPGIQGPPGTVPEILNLPNYSFRALPQTGTQHKYFDISSTGSIQDVYTVPSGKFACTANLLAYNETSSTIIGTAYLKRGGVYYRISNRPAINGLSSNFILLGSATILNAGDTLAVQGSSLGLRFTVNITEFNETASVTGKTLLLANANTNLQTLYEVPAGKMATGITNISDLPLIGTRSGWLMLNDGSGTHTLEGYYDNGSSLLLYPRRVLGPSSSLTANQLPATYLRAGEKLYVQSNNNATGCSVRVSVIEFDA